MKFKQGTIELLLDSGAKQTVRAFICGNMAYHRPSSGPESQGAGYWTCTHIPSGFAAGRANNLKNIRAIVATWLPIVAGINDTDGEIVSTKIQAQPGFREALNTVKLLQYA